MGAIVSSGLGGGSFIYANVMIRKDEKWFVEEDPNTGERWNWPVQRAELDSHYDEVERMLDVQQYPFDRAPYNMTPKTREFEAVAKRLDLDWRLPNLAVTFANKGEGPVTGEPIREEHRNLHDRTRQTCRLVGECNFGCNYGSTCLRPSGSGQRSVRCVRSRNSNRSQEEEGTPSNACNASWIPTVSSG